MSVYRILTHFCPPYVYLQHNGVVSTISSMTSYHLMYEVYSFIIISTEGHVKGFNRFFFFFFSRLQLKFYHVHLFYPHDRCKHSNWWQHILRHA